MLYSSFSLSYYKTKLFYFFMAPPILLKAQWDIFYIYHRKILIISVHKLVGGMQGHDVCKGMTIWMSRHNLATFFNATCRLSDIAFSNFTSNLLYIILRFFSFTLLKAALLMQTKQLVLSNARPVTIGNIQLQFRFPPMIWIFLMRGFVYCCGLSAV